MLLVVGGMWIVCWISHIMGLALGLVTGYGVYRCLMGSFWRGIWTFFTLSLLLVLRCSPSCTRANILIHAHLDFSKLNSVPIIVPSYSLTIN